LSNLAKYLMISASRGLCDMLNVLFRVAPDVSDDDGDDYDVLSRLADEWEEHSRSGLEDVERHMFNPVNYFLIAKRFTIDWNQKLAQYFPIDINQRTTLLVVVVM